MGWTDAIRESAAKWMHEKAGDPAPGRPVEPLAARAAAPPPVTPPGPMSAENERSLPRETVKRTARTPIFIVCSARPGVGKTLVARLALGFYSADKHPVRGFDLDPETKRFSQCAPRAIAVADISTTKGQMALFDQLILQDGCIKVVDLPHRLFEPFFVLAEQISFFVEARRRGIEPIVMFCADPHPDSAKAYGRLGVGFPDTVLVPVQNEVHGRIARFRDLFPVQRAAALPLRLLMLPPALKAAIDRGHYSFADLRNTLPEELPLEVAFELRSWTKRAFIEFRELELRLLLEKVRGSLADLG